MSGLFSAGAELLLAFGTTVLAAGFELMGMELACFDEAVFETADAALLDEAEELAAELTSLSGCESEALFSAALLNSDCVWLET